MAADHGDFSQLSYLNEEILLKSLKSRYKEDKIYSRCGDILIAVNPNRTLPIYQAQHHEKFRQSTATQQEPHVFATAALAYRRLEETKSDQVILVSGESGAGKTETTKFIIKHVVNLCGNEKSDLHKKILSINPLMEAFGNARTNLNGNSSRFGKFIQINFDSNGGIQGAVVRDYLLEKSRVVHQPKGEGNFHIFYAFIAGVDPSLKRKLLLDKDSYRITENMFGDLNYHRNRYNEYLDIMRLIKLPREDIEAVQIILAAILHITEIRFEEDSSSSGVVVSNEDDMINAASLLGVDPEQFGKSLVLEDIVLPDETITTFKSQEQAEDGRDALAKSLYERLFGWMIRNINLSLHTRQDYEAGRMGSLGILDICGFEIMPTNGLEQLCINLVNEQLQSFMNKQVFIKEQEIYAFEGLTLDDVKYPDNAEIIEMFTMTRYGIIALIDEDTKLAQATSTSLVTKLRDKWGHHDHFVCPVYDIPEFGIKHFAGMVTYDADHFLEKNADNLSSGIFNCVRDSENELISDLFKVQKSLTGSISGIAYNYRQSNMFSRPMKASRVSQITRTTVTELRKSMKSRGLGNNMQSKKTSKDHKTQLSYFMESIKDLLSKMNSADPLFIRCIKPNNEQRERLFVDEKVNEQLSYLGIKEIAKIRKMCYPIRSQYKDFSQCYNAIVPSTEKSISDIDKCKSILKEFINGNKDYKFGKTQIFMMESVKITLDLMKRRRIDMCVKKAARKWKEVWTQKKIEEQRLNEKFKAEIEASKPLQRERHHSVRFGSETVEELPEEDYSLLSDSLHGSNRASQVSHSNTDLFFESSGTNNSTEDDNGDYEDIKSWDVFEIVPPDSESTGIPGEFMIKVIKLVLYVLFFCIVLGCCVCQKLSLIITLKNIQRWNESSGKSETNTKSLNYIKNLVLAVCIPASFNILISTSKLLFGHFQRPSLITFILATFFEVIHAFGLCLLVYGVLPFCKYSILVVLLLSAVAFIPSILLTFTAAHTRTKAAKDAENDSCFKTRVCSALTYLLDGLSILAQGSVIAVLILLFNGNEVYDRDDREDNMKDVPHFRIIEIILGFICVSFGWWENFLDDRFLCRLSETNRVKNFNLFIRYELQSGRHFTVIPAAIAKILVVLGITYAYYPPIIYNGILNGLPKENDINLVPIIMLHLASIVAFYIGVLVCKLNMQIVSFSLPLLFVTPVTIVAIILDCEYDFIENLIGPPIDDICNPSNLTDNPTILAIGSAWYLSLMWITRHIWFPRQERLARHERLFVNPLYCVVLTTESLLLNRRRHMRRVRKTVTKKDKNVVTYKLARTESKKDETESASGSKTDTESIYPRDDQKQNVEIPMVYACATMWHETRTEMVQLLKSIHRVDAEQCMRRTVEELSSGPDPDFFNFEAHIFFDDIMEETDDEDWQVNDFVALLVDCMQEAISSVLKTYLKPHPPVKISTPYGGQLVYKMPGGNLLYVHLKDKNKIRHRKRWSQVMYMYYLLGFKLLKGCKEEALEAFKVKQENSGGQTLASDLSEIFSEETKIQSENTFILALDGDTDFTPVSVQILLDRMKKNEKAAAACGRIHPIGSGPIVWFQKFEYAVGHWLQKATEHVFGCVLCSPGCFSLFRASALMDQNVMKKYTILPSDPGHYLQYDQGEDRWLCTLLLQQGYRVDYAAAADAVTYAPEGFNEFFNQRRRWMPSTMANIMDLLGDYKNTIKKNNNISLIYIFYQGALMLSTVLGPATVLMMISGAFKQVFDLDIWWAYALSLIPAVAYVIICLTCKSKVQLFVAVLLSTYYAFVMVVVLAGTILIAVTESPWHPSFIFLAVLILIFIFTGLLHVYEFDCLPWGALYFLCIPSGYLLLVIFSLCNLDNISWGTREVAKKKTKAEQEAEKAAQQSKKKEKEQGFFSRIFFNKGILNDLKEIFAFGKREKEDALLLEIKSMNEKLSKMSGDSHENEDLVEIKVETHLDQKEVDGSTPNLRVSSQEIEKSRKKPKSTDPNLPFWIEDHRLGKGDICCLDPDELQFWEDLIKKYLYPIDKDPEKEKQVKASLQELRNNVVYGMSMVNLLWIGINFIFQYKPNEATIIVLPYSYKGEPLKVEVLGFVFIFFFGVVLIVQFIGMIIHRYGTFIHFISITEIRGGKRDQTEFEKMLEAYRVIQNDSLGQIIVTQPPNKEDLRKSLVASRRSRNPNMRVNPNVIQNIRSTGQRLSRPLPPIRSDPLEDFRQISVMNKPKPSLGFDLRRTAKGLIKQAEKQGIHFDNVDLDPPPDYDEDEPDPVFDFLKDKNTMSRIFAKKYQKHANAHKARRPSYLNRRGGSFHNESLSRNNRNGASFGQFGANLNGRINNDHTIELTQF